MEWTSEKLAKARHLLAEEKAVLVQKGAVEYGTGSSGARRTRQKIVRQWPQVSDGDRALCDAYLLEYASAANDAPGHIVHDPKTDRETFPGDWRPTRTDLSRLKTDPREQGVYQTLLFPADASDVDGEWPSEENWLNHVHTQTSTGSAPLQLPCARPSRGTRLSVDSRLDKESGEWESQKRTDRVRPDTYSYRDGSPIETSTHEKGEHQSSVPTPSLPADGHTLRLEVDMDPYGTFSTHKVDTEAHEKSTGEYTASDNALQSTTEENVRNAEEAPNAGENETVNARLNEFGRVDFTKTKTTPKPADATAEADEWSEKTTSLAYRNADAPKNAIDGVEDDNAIVPSATAHKNEFGKFDGSVQVTVPVPQTSGPYTVENGTLRKVESTFHFNKDPRSVPEASVSGGTATTWHPRVNKFGLLDLEERKTSPGTQGTDAWKRIYPAEWWTETVYTMEFRNWTDVPKKEDFGVSGGLVQYGVLSNHNVNYNDLDLFDGYLVLTVPVEQQTDEVVIEDTDLRMTTVQNFFNQEAKPPVATSSNGTVTTYHAQKNRFGLWDYEKRTVVNKSAGVAEYTSEDAFFETTRTEQRFNQNDPEQARKSDGTIQTVHNRLNESGTYDIEKRTVEAEARQSAAITIEDSAERTVKVQHFHNQPSAPSGAAYNAGSAKTTSFSGVQLNRFGFYDFTRVETTSKGSFGNGYSFTYKGPWTHGVKSRTTITSSKGNNYELLEWGKWRHVYSVTVAKHTTVQAAQSALSGKTDVNHASIVDGGNGIWYSHLVTVTKEWT